MQLSASNLYIFFTHIRCDLTALQDALIKRVMVTPEEVIKRSLDPEGAKMSRDGFAKTMYSRLFDWYVASSFDFSGPLPLFHGLLTRRF